jgi:hypothetical protein
MAPIMTYAHIWKEKNHRHSALDILDIFLIFPAYAPLIYFTAVFFFFCFDIFSDVGALLTLLFALLPLLPVFFVLRYFVRRMLKITSAADNHSTSPAKSVFCRKRQ